MTLIADAAHPASRALSPHESGYADSAASASATRCSARARRRSSSFPPWSIVHSRFWKAQVPYLARHFRVITFDPRGSGRSDRPDTPAGYGPQQGRRRRDRRPRRHRYPPLRVRRPLRDRRRRPAARHRPSGARRRRRLHDARAADLTPAARAHRQRLRGRRSPTTRAGRSPTATTGSRTSAATSSSSSAAACPSRTRRSRSRTRSAGGSRARRTRSRSRSRRPTWTSPPRAS